MTELDIMELANPPMQKLYIKPEKLGNMEEGKDQRSLIKYPINFELRMYVGEDRKQYGKGLKIESQEDLDRLPEKLHTLTKCFEDTIKKLSAGKNCCDEHK